MYLTALALVLESFLCNVFLRPNSDAELDGISLLLLAINIVVLFVSINSSVSADVNGLENRSENRKEQAFVKTALFLSLILRLLILMWDVYARHIFILPNSEGDAEWYHKIGVSFAYGSRMGKVDLYNFKYYVGLLYKFIGVQKITVQFINIYLAICSVIMIYKILCRFDISSRVRILTISVVSYLPNLMMITTFFLQESVVAFFIVSSLYFFTKWWFGDGNYNFMLSILMSFAGGMLHMGGLTVGFGILIMLILIANKERKIDTSPSKFMAMALVGVVALVALVTVGGPLLDKLGGDVSAESILQETQNRTGGGAVYSIGITGLPPTVDLVVNTPIRMFYFIFSPLPWMWRGLGDILGFFGSTIFYFWVAYCVIKAIKEKPLKHEDTAIIGSLLITLLVIILIAAIMFGWGVSNAGSVLRHREKFTYLFAVTFAVSNEIIYRAGKRNEPENLGHSSGIQRKRLS